MIFSYIRLSNACQLSASEKDNGYNMPKLKEFINRINKTYGERYETNVIRIVIEDIISKILLAYTRDDLVSKTLINI